MDYLYDISDNIFLQV